MDDSNVAYVPNPGNVGDGLIALGSYTLFDELGTKPRIIDVTKTDPFEGIETVLYGGGSAWIEGLHPFGYKLMMPFVKAGGRLTILPQSTLGYEDFFADHADQIDIFVREKYSYQRLVDQRKTKDIVHLCHDLAFAVDVGTLVGDIGKIGHGTLKCFRSDEESLSPYGYSDSVDLPMLRNGKFWTSRLRCEEILRPIAQIFCLYETIETDRLHMCILAAMLGRKVRFHSNIYYKNLGVYEYSLSAFPNVEFIGQRDVNVQGAKQELATRLRRNEAGRIKRTLSRWNRSIRKRLPL
jgi:exopolysaccharide biosynthesis predicted pyruvyltransferase EpsI